MGALKVISAVFGALASRPAAVDRPRLVAVDEITPDKEFRIGDAYPSQSESAALLDVYLGRSHEKTRTTYS